jgi:hypothetical protein
MKVFSLFPVGSTVAHRTKRGNCEGAVAQKVSVLARSIAPQAQSMT